MSTKNEAAERCDWIEAGQPYPNECGRLLPCSRHSTDHEGHPFGFTVTEAVADTKNEAAERLCPQTSMLRAHIGHLLGVLPDGLLVCEQCEEEVPVQDYHTVGDDCTETDSEHFAALDTERRNTVERLRTLFHEQVGPFVDGEGGVGHRVIGQYGVDAILDEVSRG